jgi:hypothetical protein
VSNRGGCPAADRFGLFPLARGVWRFQFFQPVLFPPDLFEVGLSHEGASTRPVAEVLEKRVYDPSLASRTASTAKGLDGLVITDHATGEGAEEAAAKTRNLLTCPGARNDQRRANKNKK